jgi:hypothetical protein
MAGSQAQTHPASSKQQHMGEMNLMDIKFRGEDINGSV